MPYRAVSVLSLPPLTFWLPDGKGGAVGLGIRVRTRALLKAPPGSWQWLSL